MWRRYVFNLIKGVMKNTSSFQLSFAQKEQHCETTFQANGPFWHLCTPGQLTEILCETEEDYKFCVTLVAIAASFSGVRVITFEVMSNHIHVVLSGDEEKCEAFFHYYKNKLRRYYTQAGRYKNLDGFTHQLIPIIDLEDLRIEIVYVNRNGYVVRDDCTPFSYPWGSGHLYFNLFLAKIPAIRYNTLSYRDKRIVCQ